MEISPLLIYFVFQADNIVNLFTVLTVLSTTCTLVVGILFFFSDIDDDVHARAKRMMLVALPFALLFGVCVAFMPNSKTVAAAYVIPKLTKSDVAKQLSGDTQKLYELGIMALDAHIQRVSRKDERK